MSETAHAGLDSYTFSVGSIIPRHVRPTRWLIADDGDGRTWVIGTVEAEGGHHRGLSLAGLFALDGGYGRWRADKVAHAILQAKALEEAERLMGRQDHDARILEIARDNGYAAERHWAHGEWNFHTPLLASWLRDGGHVSL